MIYDFFLIVEKFLFNFLHPNLILLMSGSCHLDRASNVEIGVECQIFVIVIFFNGGTYVGLNLVCVQIFTSDHDNLVEKKNKNGRRMASFATTFASWHNIRHFIDLLAKRSYVPCYSGSWN